MALGLVAAELRIFVSFFWLNFLNSLTFHESLTEDLRFNLNLAQAHIKLRDFSKAIDSKLQTSASHRWIRWMWTEMQAMWAIKEKQWKTMKNRQISTNCITWGGNFGPSEFYHSIPYHPCMIWWPLSSPKIPKSHTMWALPNFCHIRAHSKKNQKHKQCVFDRFLLFEHIISKWALYQSWILLAFLHCALSNSKHIFPGK